MRRLPACLVLIPVLLAGCLPQIIPIDLPAAGRVYFERQKEGRTVLVPAPGVLVLASRINACDRGRWIPEGSTNGIDEYLVRTDSNGVFRIPSRAFRGVCSRVVLLAQAFVPGHHSLAGRAALLAPWNAAKGIYSGVTENNAILQPRSLSASRIRELYRDLYSATSSPQVTIPMADEIYREIGPELGRLLPEYAGSFPFEERYLEERLGREAAM